jgi:hypothetical protein
MAKCDYIKIKKHSTPAVLYKTLHGNSIFMGQIDVHMRATLKEGYIHLALVPLLVYNIFTEIIAVLGENKITSAEMNTLMNMFILYFKYKEVIHAEYMTEFKMTFITSIQLALWQVKYKEKRRLLCCV